MNIIEKQVQLGRDIFAINTNVVRDLVGLQMTSIRQLFVTNQEFASKLPEVRDVSSLVKVQRGYGKALWQDAQYNLSAGGEIVKSALENTGVALRKVVDDTVEAVDEQASAAVDTVADAVAAK